MGVFSEQAPAPGGTAPATRCARESSLPDLAKLRAQTPCAAPLRRTMWSQPKNCEIKHYIPSPLWKASKQWTIGPLRWLGSTKPTKSWGNFWALARSISWTIILSIYPSMDITKQKLRVRFLWYRYHTPSKATRLSQEAREKTMGKPLENLKKTGGIGEPK